MMGTQKELIIAPNNPDAEVMGDAIEAKVEKVFDGDGFLANVWHPMREDWVMRVPFRFAFIDAPEMEQPLGPEAMEFLHRLVAGKTLQIFPIGKESTGYMPIDQYKRMLCMAFLTEPMQVGEIKYYFGGKSSTGWVKKARPVTRNLELEIIVNGWAWVTEQYAFDREEEYFEAQEDARQHRRGVWALDNPEPPWAFKRKKRRLRQTNDRQPSLFSAANDRCPVEGCGGHLVERKSAGRPFRGCSNFPRCRFSENTTD